MSQEAAVAYVDPTADSISPWLWLPPTLLSIAALLWFSLYREHFIITYYRALDYSASLLSSPELTSLSADPPDSPPPRSTAPATTPSLQSELLPKIPCWPSSRSPSRHIRLSAHDLEAGLLDDDSDDGSPSGAAYSPALSDDADELPTSSRHTARSRRVGTWYLAGIPLPPVKAATHRVLDTLGWTRTDGGPSLTRALWGTREGDRLGRIKLGGLPGASGRRGSAGENGGAGLGAMWGRVTDLAGAGAARGGVAEPSGGYEAIPSAPKPKSGSVSHHAQTQNGDELFAVGNDVEEGAVELPADFTLPPSPLEGRE